MESFQASVDKKVGACYVEEAVLEIIIAPIFFKIHLASFVAFSSTNMSNRPTAAPYPDRESAPLPKKPRTTMKRFGGLVTGSYRPGRSQGNYYKACLKQSMPAIGLIINMLPISGTFLNQPMVAGCLPPYKKPLTNWNR
jgi:hypothetical protein